MQDMRQAYRSFLWGKLKERDYLNNASIDVRIILKRICKKEDGKVWNGFICGLSDKFMQ